MKRLIAGALLLTSCAAYNDTIKYANSVSTELASTAIPLTNQVCMSFVQQCSEEGDAECPRYHECDKFRQHLVNSLVAIKLAILDAETARAIGDTEKFEEAVAQAISLIAQVRKQLADMGMI